MPKTVEKLVTPFKANSEMWAKKPQVIEPVPEGVRSLIGEKKGTLQIVGYLGSAKSGSGAKMLAKCDCGKYESKISFRWRRRGNKGTCEWCSYETKVRAGLIDAPPEVIKELADKDRKKELIAELCRVKEIVKRIPLIKDWKEFSSFTKEDVLKLYKNWIDFIIDAGFTQKEYKAQNSLLHTSPDGANENHPAKAVTPTRTRDDIMRDVIRLIEASDKIPDINDYAEKGEFTVPEAMRLFKAENWCDVLKNVSRAACEMKAQDKILHLFSSLPEKNRKARVSDKELLDELERIYKLLFCNPSSSDWNKYAKFTLGTVFKRFKGWSNFIIASGLHKADQAQKTDERAISDFALLSSLRAVSVKIKRIPTIAEYLKEAEEDNKYSSAAFVRAFGSWNNAIKEAKLDYEKRNSLKEKIKDDLIMVKEKLKDYPLTADYAEHGKYPLRKVIPLYGKTWKDVLMTVFSLSPDEISKLRNSRFQTDEELISELKKLAGKVGFSPPTTLAQKKGIKTYRLIKTYGSWQNVLKKAELSTKPRYKRRKELISEQDLIKDFFIIEKLVGRTPTNNDIKNNSIYSLATFGARLGNGSYVEALNYIRNNYAHLSTLKEQPISSKEKVSSKSA